MGNDPKWILAHGARFPYDATDGWWNDDGSETLPAKDWAHAAARGILADLWDRRGIKDGLDGIDYEVRVEITESIAAIIREAASTRTPEDIALALAMLDASRADMPGGEGVR